MTFHERAIAVVEQLSGATYSGNADSATEEAAIVERAIAEAVAEEREACARVAEEHRAPIVGSVDVPSMCINGACENIARAIRARKMTP